MIRTDLSEATKYQLTLAVRLTVAEYLETFRLLADA